MRVKSQNISFSGAVGDLEGIIDSRTQMVCKDYVAICCHPHPQHGGTMTNKVIYTTSRSLADLGIASIRFNFRGVGNSEGEYADGIGEQDDLRAVVKWANQQYPYAKLILAGFSFGAYISALQAKPLGASLLICVAPPVGRIEFTAFTRPDCAWLIVQGDEDELVDPKAVHQWADSFDNPPSLRKMAGASHFFHGKLVELRGEIAKFTAQALKLSE